MAHTYGSCLYHFVFSTHNRQNTLPGEWRRRLWEYMGGTARNEGMESLGIGGTENHCHALIMIPPAMAPAKGIQFIKGNSSRWINETLEPPFPFAWQEGYGVFTIGFSQIEKTRAYIQNQEERHRELTFEEEYTAFLKKHMIVYKEDYVFG